MVQILQSSQLSKNKEITLNFFPHFGLLVLDIYFSSPWYEVAHEDVIKINIDIVYTVHLRSWTSRCRCAESLKRRHDATPEPLYLKNLHYIHIRLFSFLCSVNHVHVSVSRVNIQHVFCYIMLLDLLFSDLFSLAKQFYSEVQIFS